MAALRDWQRAFGIAALPSRDADIAVEPQAPAVEESPYSVAEVRELLRRALPTDADFTAFCLDYLPETYALFTNGMDRVQKEALLLTHEEATTVRAALERWQHDLQ